MWSVLSAKDRTSKSYFTMHSTYCQTIVPFSKQNTMKGAFQEYLCVSSPGCPVILIDENCSAEFHCPGTWLHPIVMLIIVPTDLRYEYDHGV